MARIRVPIMIRLIRAANKTTQKQLGEELTVTAQTVSNWESGKTTPPARKLEKLVKMFESISIYEDEKGVTSSKKSEKCVCCGNAEQIGKSKYCGTCLGIRGELIRYTRWLHYSRRGILEVGTVVEMYLGSKKRYGVDY